MKIYTPFLFLALMVLCGLYSKAGNVEVTLIKPEGPFWTYVELYKADKKIYCYDTVVSLSKETKERKTVEQFEAYVSRKENLLKGKYTVRYTNLFGLHHDTTIYVDGKMVIEPVAGLDYSYKRLAYYSSPSSLRSFDDPVKVDSTLWISPLIKAGDTAYLYVHHYSCYGGYRDEIRLVLEDSVTHIKAVFGGPQKRNVEKAISLRVPLQNLLRYTADFERDVKSFPNYTCSAGTHYFFALNKAYLEVNAAICNHTVYDTLLADLRLKLIGQ